MSKTIVKNFSLLDIVSISTYLSNKDVQDRMNCLSIKSKWAIKKNCNTFKSYVDTYDEVRNELVNRIRDEFFTEEKSEEQEVIQKDDSGKDVLDEYGKPIKTTQRQIKSEYMIDYQTEISNADKKLQEVLSDRNDVSIIVIDLDKEIDNIPDDHSFDLTMDDLDILNLFNIEE